MPRKSKKESENEKISEKRVPISEELQDSLKDIVKSCEDEDKGIRDAMMRQWRKNEEFWHGVQFLFWSQADNSWRSPQDWDVWGDDFEDLDEQIGSFSDKVVDIFRGHGESIISALAAQIPALRFVPDDADDIQDLQTARTYSKIADLVQRHNKAKLVFLRALYFLSLQGLVASYLYKDSDFKYGSYTVTSFDKAEVEIPTFTCQECGYVSDQDWSISQSGTDQNPEEGETPQESTLENTSEALAGVGAGEVGEPAPSLNQIDQNVGTQQPFEYDPTATEPQIPAGKCPQCFSTEKPKEEKRKETIPTNPREEQYPKTRAKIEVFGPLHFKVSYHAANQDQCSYLIHYGPQGKDIVSAEYPEKFKEIWGEKLENTDQFSRSLYSMSLDPDIEQKHLVLVKKIWLRPTAFFREQDEDKRNELLETFPDGCKVVLIGKAPIFAEVVDEKLDDRWKIGQAGLSTLIHSDPILRPLVQIQEMRNQLVNLIMDTIEHGIPSEFADPETLNFDTYGRFEAVPGYIYKVKPKRPGAAIAESFYTSSRATLSREVALFLKQLDQDAQFCIGSFPSIYGGPSEGKSRTFAEYAASRQMALQRLSIVWSFVVDWWVRTIEGLVKLYKECIVEDDKFVKFDNGNYINVWIKQSEMQGKIGGVEAEASETFPVSLTQIKDLIMKLMEMNNEFINSVLYNPENTRTIQDAFALTQLKIPGEDQRIKQSGEINELLKTSPADEMTSTVQVDPDVDDHAIHIETLKTFLCSAQGLEEKQSNPGGYQNCILHLKMHEAAQQQLLMQAMMNQPPAASKPVQKQAAQNGAKQPQ